MTLFLILIFLLNFLIFINFQKFLRIINIYDKPDKKLKIHDKKISLAGGVILGINFSILFIYQFFFTGDFLSIKITQITFIELLATLFLIYSYFCLGIYDDKFQLSPNKRLFFSCILILSAIFFNEKIIISELLLSFHKNKIFLGQYSNIFTIFCFLILINALNFFDGINCQSSIIFIVSFLYLFIKSEMNYFYLITIFFILFFFQFNIRNKLFLGDSGVYLLGIILSINLIFEYNIKKNIIFADEIFFLLLLPGIDLLRLTIMRISKKQNPFLGDRSHIHHLLINKFSLLKTNIILFLLIVLPIFLYSILTLNFFIVLTMTAIIYIFIILKLMNTDNENNYIRKKK